jgi:hypothetical protein
MVKRGSGAVPVPVALHLAAHSSGAGRKMRGLRLRYFLRLQSCRHRSMLV